MGGAPSAARDQNVVECQQPPRDTISSLAWAPLALAQQKNFLAASSWDKTVKVWGIQKTSPTSVDSTPVANFDNNMPILDCTISKDGNVYYAGCCQTAKTGSLAQTGTPPRQVAAHDHPIKSCKWSDEANVLATGCWEGKVKIWDTKSQNPGKVFDVGAPVVDMCITGRMMTVLTAKHIYVHDLSTMTQHPVVQPHKGLREQMRAIENFTDQTGFIVSSIGGRAAMMWLNNSTNDFSFRCHRENSNVDVFSVNCISVHPEFHSFATSGSNGVVSVWDGAKKEKIVNIAVVRNTISAGRFDSTGQIFAYAASYDWTKGGASHNQAGHSVCVKPVLHHEVVKNP